MSLGAFQATINETKILKHMGLQVLEASRGRCKLRMPLVGNDNHFSTMHAGVMYTLAETTGGVLFFATFDVHKYFPLVTEMKIQYRRAATSAVTVEVVMEEAEIQRLETLVAESGKAAYSWTTRLLDEQGQVVAVSTNQYQMRAHGSFKVKPPSKL
jgi:uncharacterized protein (TIGR00369 family)